MKNVICYSYSPPGDELREINLYRQLYHSFKSLRERNPKIDIYLFVFDEENSDLERMIRPFNVNLKKMGDIRKLLGQQSDIKRNTLSKYPYSHKWILLSLMKDIDCDSLMYVDVDTYFFADPEKIFKKHKMSAYGTPFLRESASSERKISIGNLCQQCEHYFKIANIRKRLLRSSIVLFQQKEIKNYCENFDCFYDILWTLILAMATNNPGMLPASDYVAPLKNYLKINRIGKNKIALDEIFHMGTYHLEELAAAIYFSKIKIDVRYLDYSDVWQGSDFFKNKFNAFRPPVLAHYTNRHTQAFLSWRKTVPQNVYA